MTTPYRIVPEQNASWQRPVVAYQSTPPVSPNKGDRYIVKTPATPLSAWVGMDEKVVTYDGANWLPDTPATGWELFNNTDSKKYQFIGGVWVVDATDISGKADKVGSATNGDVAGLDASGNLTDTGILASDITAGLGAIPNKADKIVPGAVGNLAGLDAGGDLTDSGIAGAGVTAAVSATPTYDSDYKAIIINL